MTTSAITVYGAPWCPDCRRSKQFLGEQRMPYEWIDIDHDEDAREYVSRINSGKQIIPTIVFEDGSFIAERVTLLARGDQLSASPILREKAADHPGLEVRLRTQVQEFRGSPKLKSVVVVDDEGGLSEIPAAGAFIFIGLDPNTAFLEGYVELDPRRAIQTGPAMETNVEGVFAAGDARAGSTKQLTAAVGEGATAALMIREYLKDAQGDRGY